MKYPAKLIVSYYAGGAQNAYFDSVEAAKTVLDAFSERLGKIKEYTNRDEDPVFRYQGSGAFYAVDLRKVCGASLEVIDEWADVTSEAHLNYLVQHRSVRAEAGVRGLAEEFEASNELQVKLASKGQA